MLNDPTEGLIYQILNRLATVAVLNLLWVGLTLLGGVLFGWAPATAALLAVWRLIARKEEPVSLTKAMWAEYRKNFLKANGIGWIMLIAGALLIFYSFTLTQWRGVLMVVFWGIFLVIALSYLIVLAFIFPVYSHYDINFLDNFKYAMAIGLSHLHYVFIIGATVATIIWASNFFPLAYITATISVLAFFTMRLSLIVFNKIGGAVHE